FNIDSMKICSLPLLFFLAVTPFFSDGQIHIEDSPVVRTDTGLYAIVVSKNHSLIYENYFNQHSATELFNDQSLTKGIMSILIGIAIDKGFISSLDEKIIRFFPDLKQDTDQRKQSITIRQIMNQASGLYHEDLARLDKYLALSNPSAFTIQQTLNADPGTTFHYSNAASHLLSVIITMATGLTTLAFANKYLFGPMKIERVEWMKMNDGYYDGSGLLSIRLSIRDLNRIGWLLLDSGRYGGRQIISSSFIRQLLYPDRVYHTDWGFPGSEYALCWYHKNYRGINIIYGLGWGGQFNFIIPTLHAVITVNESISDATAIRQSILFQEKIFPLILNALERSGN
ncbi:MAG TPA: serine hydrolase, partial [Puia sp.]|nr:serine hydrolase [Puia sp.]